MKAIKFLLLIIILVLLGLLGYQNQDYFLTATALQIDLKVASLHYTAEALALPNWAYWGFCFGAGLILTGLKGLSTAFRLGRETREKEARISEMTGQINALKAELEIFTHDPFIKKAIDRKAAEAKAAQEAPDTPEKSGETPADAN